MTRPAAFRATYADWRLIKTRQSVQVIFEIPLEAANEVLDVLGGMPDPSKERWFGIAAIKTETEVMQAAESNTTKSAARPDQASPRPDRAKRDWQSLLPSVQAGIRCDDPIFGAFLMEEREDDLREASGDWAECVRLICGVSSRADLNTNQKARVIWHQLNDQFQAWERVGA